MILHSISLWWAAIILIAAEIIGVAEEFGATY